MYPLVTILGAAAALDRPVVAAPAPLLAVPGAGVAAYHTWLQSQAGPPGCGIETVASCGAVLYRVAGLSIPTLALAAFVLVGAALVGAHYYRVRGHDTPATGEPSAR